MWYKKHIQLFPLYCTHWQENLSHRKIINCSYIQFSIKVNNISMYNCLPTCYHTVKIHIVLLYEQILIFFAPGIHKFYSETLVITTSMEYILQNISLGISVITVYSKVSEGKKIHLALFRAGRAQ